MAKDKFSPAIALVEIEKTLDKTFKRSGLADDDNETPLAREVYTLEEAIRAILDYLKLKGEE